MAEEQNEELRLREEQDGSAIVGEDPPKDEGQTEDDERLSKSEDTNEDEQGHAEETAEEAEARKQRNRERRLQSKENKKQFVENLKRQLESERSAREQLEQRLSVVERKSTGSEMAQLENAEKEAAQYYNHFKHLNAKAIEAADGATANDAMEKMFLAKQRLDQIGNIKKALTQRQAQPVALDPRLVQHAQSWMQENSWYRPDGSDRDSARVLLIDREVKEDGYVETTPEYWEELSNRVKKELPHRQKQGYNNSGVGSSSARSPVAGSGRESSSSKSTSGYKLSAERVQAMKEAGIWDDPKQRADMVRRYQQQDKENQNG